jgi:hypothetical protein
MMSSIIKLKEHQDLMKKYIFNLIEFLDSLPINPSLPKRRIIG